MPNMTQFWFWGPFLMLIRYVLPEYVSGPSKKHFSFKLQCTPDRCIGFLIALCEYQASAFGLHFDGLTLP